jgi:hypothetical protein
MRLKTLNGETSQEPGDSRADAIFFWTSAAEVLKKWGFA